MDPTHLHVVCNMIFINVVAVNLSVQLLLILLEANKSLVTVRNIKATIPKAPCSSTQTEAGLKLINCMFPLIA